MPDSQNKDRRFRFRLPPAESQIAMTLIAALLGVWALPFDFGSGPALLLALMFIAGMYSKKAWLIYLLIGIFTYLTYSATPPYIGSRMHSIVFSDIFSALILIVFGAACFRVLESERFVRTFFPSAKLGLNPKLGIRFEFPSLLGGRWWAIPLAMFLATALLTIPSGKPLRDLGIKPTTSRFIFLILLLFFSWFVCRAVVGLLVRWRMKPEQADVHCRSLIAAEFWKDVKPIEQRRVKQRESQ